MIRYSMGNIFESNANVILHQVNCQGVMGSGVAKQVHDKYPKVYALYRELCDAYKNDKEKLLGVVQIVYVNKSLAIANLFAQNEFGRNGKCYTNYEALEICLMDVNKRFKGKSVAVLEVAIGKQLLD